MPKTTYKTPHLLGRVTFADKSSFRPDGDTVNLPSPVLIDTGGHHQPKSGIFEVVVGAKHRKVTIAGGKKGTSH